MAIWNKAIILSICGSLCCAEPSGPPEIEAPACCATTSRTAALPVNLFAKPDAWRKADEAAWQWTDAADKSKVLELIAQNNYAPKVRSPRNLAWYQAAEWKDFTLTFECQLSSFNEGNNDLCIAFAGLADDQFYYIHLGEKADAAHHQIHIVNHADRSPITTWRTAGTPWKKETWHRVKITRNSSSGDIGVWFDDSPQPILTAKDKTFLWGKIGLGSFDDLGKFRKVMVQGTSRKTP